MTAINPVQFGGSGTDDTSLFLKEYTGSFVTAPRSGVLLFNGVADRFIYRKRPNSGKSWQFLMMAEVPDAEDFDPGADLLGQIMAVEEGTIVTDKYVVCHKWIGKDKMDMSHFEILGQLAERHKSRLERLYDKRAMITAALGARQTTAVTKNGLNVHNGGNRVTRTGGTTSSGAAVLSTSYPLSATGAANLRADLRALALSLDQDNIAPGPQNRAILMEPYLRSVLTYDNTGQVFSKDYVTTSDQMRHEVEVLERFAVLGYPNTTSNNGPLPDQNITDGPTKYQGNFTPAASNGAPGVLCFSRSVEAEYGLGMIEFETLKHTVKYFEEKLSWLVMTYMRTGCDIMHPWCLGSIESIT
jgi:hypothetical protein